MTETAGFGATSPSAPFAMLGSPDAVACEGDSCLVTPAGTVVVPSDVEPGRRGVSR